MQDEVKGDRRGREKHGSFFASAEGEEKVVERERQNEERKKVGKCSCTNSVRASMLKNWKRDPSDDRARGTLSSEFIRSLGTNAGLLNGRRDCIGGSEALLTEFFLSAG